LVAIGRVEPDGDPHRLADALAEQGIAVDVSVAPAMQGHPAAALATIFRSGAPPVPSKQPPVRVAVLERASEAVTLMRGLPPGEGSIVLGVGDATPVLVGDMPFGSEGPQPSVAIHSALTRRPGLVTPFDIAAVFASGGFPMLRLAGPFERRGFDYLDALAARLERDAHYEGPVTRTTVAFGLGGLALMLLGLQAGRRRIAAAFLRGAAMAPAGYLGALFIPHARWQARALSILVAFLIGFAFPARNTRRFCGWVFLSTAAAVLALEVAAASAPDGFVAHSLWANPLTSWRFFGLRNHLVAFVAGGLVAAAGLLVMRWWVLCIAAVSATVVVGAASLGANFLGVLTLTFGAAIAALGIARGGVRAWHVAVAAVGATAATALALLIDAGTPASHGGRAVQTIRGGGLDQAWEIFRRRAELNYQEITSFGWAGFVAMVLLAIVLASLFVWGWRSLRAHPSVRASAAGTAAAALAAFVMEDSGFLTAGIVGLFASTVFLATVIDPVVEPPIEGSHDEPR